MAKFLKVVLVTALSLFIFSSFSFSQEQITITTYYPSPYGSYRTLAWGNLPNSRGLLSPDQGSSIELGGSGIPYIDFSNDMTIDYDARIILVNDNLLWIDGASLLFIPRCLWMSYGENSWTTRCPVGYSFNAIAQSMTPPVTPVGGIFWCCQP